MRFLRLVSILVAFALVSSLIATAGPLALAQSVDEAESDAADARRRAEVADGLVDEAVAEREELEVQLAETISKVSDLSADLSVLGSALDRTAAQLGFADVELAGIETAIETQAVDAYMTVLSSPSVSVVNSPSVEQAMIVSSFVEDVVASGRASVDSLVIKRRNLETLQEQFLAEQAEFQELQDELNDEVARLADLYDQADAAVAQAVRRAQQADADYRAALSAVELARAREAESRRQEERAPGTTAPPTTTEASALANDTIDAMTLGSVTRRPTTTAPRSRSLRS